MALKIYEADGRDQELLGSLVSVWEDSVRATHSFLDEAEIERIRQFVPQAIAEVPELVVAEDGFDGLVAFMGMATGRLEMLFVRSDWRGKGAGRRLLELGIRRHGVTELTVNEQNPQAVGFYRHMGFSTYKRTDHDEEGGPYPLLYMRLLRA